MHDLDSASRGKRNPPRAMVWAFRTLTIVLPLLVCFVCHETGLKIGGTKYCKFSRSGQYYSNPRGYFDVLEEEGDQIIYGVNVWRVRWPPGKIPHNRESRELPTRAILPQIKTQVWQHSFAQNRAACGGCAIDADPDSG